MLILGIDPGLNRIGWGLIRKDRRLSLIDHGTIRIAERGRPALVAVQREVEKLLNGRRPDLAAVEKLYFVKNRRTALSVAEARGVIMLAIIGKNIPFLELTPTEVKQSVAGNGRADKKAVAKMAAAFLGCGPIKGGDDASDALAVAIAASAKYRFG